MLLPLLFAIFLFPLRVSSSPNVTDDFLRPAYGVSFVPVGLLQSHSEIWHIHVNYQLPSIFLKPPSTPHDISFACPSPSWITDSLNHQVCDKFSSVVNYYSAHVRDLHNKSQLLLTDINTILENHSHPSSRSKRGLPILPIIGGVLSLGLSTVNNFMINRRISTLQNALQHTDSNVLQLNDGYLHLKSSLMSLANHSSSAIDSLQNSLMAQKARIQGMEIQQSFFEDELNDTQIELLRRTNDIKQLSLYHSVYMLYFDQYVDDYRNLIRNLESFLMSLQDLVKGHLPINLVEPSKLQNILSNAEDVIYKSFPEYQIAFLDSKFYYTRQNIIFTQNSNSLMIQIPVFLKRRDQPFFNLFRIRSIHMPVTNSANKNNNSYTILNTEYQYFAYINDNYILMKQSDLDMCFIFEQMHISTQSLLQVHKSKPSCISSLFWPQDHSTITQICDFHLKTKFLPPAELLEGNNLLLLANMGSQLSLNCDSRTVPFRFSGPNYFLLKKTDLCQCSLASGKYYLEPKLESCASKASLPTFKIYYTVNIPIHLAFNPDDSPNNTIFDAPPVLPIKQHILLSNLTSNKENSPLLSIPVRTIMSKLNESKIAITTNSKFFQYSNIYAIISFVLSVLTPVLLLFTIYLWFKMTTLQTIVVGLASKTIPGIQQNVNAKSCSFSDTSAFVHPSMICLIIICTFLLIMILKKIIKCNFSYVYPWPENGKDSKSETKVFLHVTNGLSKCKLYLCTICSDQLFIDISDISIQDFDLELVLPFVCLRIDWINGTFKFLHHDFNFMFPAMATTNIFHLKTLRTLIKDDSTRLYLSYGHRIVPITICSPTLD